MLRLAQAMKPRWRDVALTILDRHDLISAETRAGYEALGWKVTVLQEDVRDWAEQSHRSHFDLCITCLFLHHFHSEELAKMMRAIASNADALVACEPRRNGFARVGSGLIGLLGTNRVTREDAVKSVVAGFTDQELTALWSHVDGAWYCEEYSAPPFTHCFTAALNGVRHG